RARLRTEDPAGTEASVKVDTHGPAHRLAAPGGLADIPQPRGRVRAGGQDAGAIGGPARLDHPVSMPHGWHLRASGQVPEANGAVDTGGQDAAALRAKGSAHDAPALAQRRAERLGRRGV